jgi:hypothetical protein
MTGSRQGRLYNLLPALYRQLDERGGQPLRALMAVLEGEFARLEGDLGAAYDDWFITTCDDWVVPYIADLLGIRDLQDQTPFIPTQRRRVANTIGYRRRKGTPAVLEHVIRDVTGWHTRSVEYSRHVSCTQHVAHTKPDVGRTVDVRQLQTLAGINGPSDTLAHTVDVDNSAQGRHNLDRVGLFFWRLRSYPITRSFACPVGSGRYTFDPLGRDVPLFHQPQPVTAITQRAQDINLPIRIGRDALAADLQAYRAQYKAVSRDHRPANSQYYGPDRSVYVERDGHPIPPWAVVSVDLGQWSEVAHVPDGAVVAVDVELGRIAFADGKEQGGPGDVVVNYAYGFSSEIGGGPYGRPYWFDEPAPDTHHIHVAKGSDVGTLQEALGRWNEYCGRCASKDEKPIGTITILDNGLYEEDELVIYLPRGAKLTIVARDGVRPTIQPDKLVVMPRAAPEKEFSIRVAMEGEEEAVEPVIDRLLHLNGLFIYGEIEVSSGDGPVEGKLALTIRHCTLMPDGLGVQFGAQDAAKLGVDIQHSIVGPLRLPAQVAAFAVQDSIIDHSGGYAIAAPAATDQVPGPPVTLKRTTVFGQVSVQELPAASEVIFTAPVFVTECEHGGISFSYVPAGSRTPPCEFCQPPDDASASKVRPRFTSVRFGDPAYAQLSMDCPSELRRGGRDGTEMGVFCHLHRPQREINLRRILDEYLPFGLSAAVFYVT